MPDPQPGTGVIIIRDIPENYHRFALFDSPQTGNIMTSTRKLKLNKLNCFFTSVFSSRTAMVRVNHFSQVIIGALVIWGFFKKNLWTLQNMIQIWDVFFCQYLSFTSGVLVCCLVFFISFLREKTRKKRQAVSDLDEARRLQAWHIYHLRKWKFKPPRRWCFFLCFFFGGKKKRNDVPFFKATVAGFRGKVDGN